MIIEPTWPASIRSEEHTSELQSHLNLVCRLLLAKKRKRNCSRRVAKTAVQTSLHPRRIQPQTTFPTPCCFFFFNDAATTEIYPLSLHAALPISNPHANGGGLLQPLSMPHFHDYAVAV